jgi:hypothetical protein
MFLLSVRKEVSYSALLGKGGGGGMEQFLQGDFFVYFIHDCFICGSVREDAAIEPRTGSVFRLSS